MLQIIAICALDKVKSTNLLAVRRNKLNVGKHSNETNQWIHGKRRVYVNRRP